MWKKIVYYAGMIVVGILFMMAFSMVQIENTYKKLVKDSINSDDYKSILALYNKYGNNNAVYEKEVNGTTIKVFETASLRTLDDENDKEYSNLDIEYSIFLVNNSFKTVDAQTSDGKTYNKRGFKVENFSYYNNGFTDGFVLKEDSNDYEANSKIYGKYSLFVDTSSLNVIQYTIPYEFMASNGIESFTKIELINPVGDVDVSIEYNFDYKSDFFTKVCEIKDKHNTSSKKNDFNEFNELYPTWEKEFRSVDGYVCDYKQSDIFGASFYIKLVAMLLCYILIILAIGDILVGKKRIIKFFKNISQGHKDDNSNIIKAEAKVVNEDVDLDK